MRSVKHELNDYRDALGLSQNENNFILKEKKFGNVTIFGQCTYLENGAQASVEKCKLIIFDLEDIMEDCPNCRRLGANLMKVRYSSQW